jgi:TolB-like protein/Tfp pilus assembly protein PilF
MPSIIEGYNYDIFISYRQKDNKHDGWVTEFVEQLKGELESTFKDEVSVYFDINPHDGLLETHDVNASLKNKLKCLVFIPIISRTYCDPRSFAWENEFKVFLEQTSDDHFGLRVGLINGNVTARVLPIQIHDLTREDKSLLEKELGGVLRAIEFIYKEPGVNRPLSPKDNDDKNLNKTNYRNQINKVANAVDEVISGLINFQTVPFIGQNQRLASSSEVSEEEKEVINTKPRRFNLITKVLSIAAILMILIIAAVIVYPKTFRSDKLANLRSSDGRISIAVMPFQNMTNDTIWNVWQNGIQNNLITSLSNSDGLKVRQIESINRFLQSKGFNGSGSLTPAIASSISQKLDASILIYGSINQAGITIRVNAQLIDPKTMESFKSFQIDGVPENILNSVDSLSRMVTDFLLISKLNKEFSPSNKYYASTSSPEAYRYFIYGQKAMNQYDNSTARNWFLQAISIDSNLITATLQIAQIYEWDGNYDEAQKWCLKAYKKRDKMTLQNKLLTNIMYAHLFETPNEMLNYWKQMVEIEDQVPLYWYLIGRNYCDVEQYDKAVLMLEKAMEIFKKWDSKPINFISYQLLLAYHKTGFHNKEKELYNIAKQDTFGKLYFDIYQIIISLDEGDTIAAKRCYIKNSPSLNKLGFHTIDVDIIKYSPEEAFMTYLALLHSDAGNLDKAERYYRKLLSLHPQEPLFLYGLASIFIDHDLDIKEGMELINKAIELSSEREQMRLMLDTKGWGLFKQGKYKEALEILQTNWDLSLKEHSYNHQAYLHLEEVKHTVEGQKN